MSNHGFGELHIGDDLPWVQFERTLDAAIDAVWEMLTTDEGLARWLAPSRVDLRPGGRIEIDFGQDGTTGGEIIEVIPGVCLEYEWRFTGEPDSVIRFELDVIDSETTRLRLVHRMLPIDQAVGYGAGWHAHLDQLEARLTGDQIDWLDRFTSVRTEYEARLG